MTIKILATRATLVVALAATLGACASQGMSSRTVSRDEVGVAAYGQTGTIRDAQKVTIGGTKSGAGATVGAVAGGAVGAQFGGGTDDRIMAGIAGAVAGALLGDAIEEGTSKQDGIQYMIRMDDGEVIYVVQPADRIYPIGQRVSVIEGRNGRVRLQPVY